MSELYLPKETPQPSGLIPMPGIDFTQPWTHIVNDVNANLIAQRYRPFQTKVPHSCVLSDHDEAKPTLDDFDPIRVTYNILGEEYDSTEQAVAKLGIHSAYWKGLAKEMSPINRTLFPYEDWQKYSTVPVVRRSNDYFLMEYHDGATTIQCGGDRDMTSCMETGVLTVNGIDVPFAKLGIDQTLLDEYLGHRKTIDRSESQANKDAIFDLRQRKASLWERLKAVYPEIDNVIEGTDRFSFAYLREAGILTTNLVQNTHSSPEEVQILSLSLARTLSEFLHGQTRSYFGINLFRNSKFYPSIEGLGNVLDIMYFAAKDYWE